MLRLTNLKPYLLLILLMVVLLFIRANGPALPDYLAKIVNTGIGPGTENAVPGDWKIDRLLPWMSKGKFVLADYTYNCWFIRSGNTSKIIPSWQASRFTSLIRWTRLKLTG
jgi:hypothetical protein